MGKYKNKVYDYAETWYINNNIYDNHEDITNKDIYSFFFEDKLLKNMSQQDAQIFCNDIRDRILQYDEERKFLRALNKSE